MGRALLHVSRAYMLVSALEVTTGEISPVRRERHRGAGRRRREQGNPLGVAQHAPHRRRDDGNPGQAWHGVAVCARRAQKWFHCAGREAGGAYAHATDLILTGCSRGARACAQGSTARSQRDRRRAQLRLLALSLRRSFLDRFSWWRFRFCRNSAVLKTVLSNKLLRLNRP